VLQGWGCEFFCAYHTKYTITPITLPHQSHYHTNHIITPITLSHQGVRMARVVSRASNLAPHLRPRLDLSPRQHLTVPLLVCVCVWLNTFLVVLEWCMVYGVAWCIRKLCACSSTLCCTVMLYACCSVPFLVWNAVSVGFMQHDESSEFFVLICQCLSICNLLPCGNTTLGCAR